MNRKSKDIPASQDVDAINRVSPSFCLAKWLQVTIDLQHGTTHSCHHPKRHAIPLEEIARNPSALHNTSFKKEQRRSMLQGTRPAECAYCWEIEDCGSSYSDRIIKSTDPWAFGHLEKIRALPWDADVAPTYLEVMLDDRCDFSCMYCMADVSTGVAHEMTRYGPYNVANSNHRMPAHPKIGEPNPYVAAFWKWLPEILPELMVLRVTGGEPFLSPRFNELLDFIATNGTKRLGLIVNSHLTHSSERLNKVLSRISGLLDEGKIGGFDLYTSLDAHGARAEYIRHGLRFSDFVRNVETTAQALSGVGKVVVMCTFNILSISSFGDLLDEVLRLKKIHQNVLLDISYLRNPEYLRANIADPVLLDRARAGLAKMEESGAFTPHETGKMSNLVAWMGTEVSEDYRLAHRRDFFRFIEEFDRRKKRAFLEIFPEYRDFYVLCKQAAFDHVHRRLNSRNSE